LRNMYFFKARRVFEGKLEACLESLDRRHYPASLLESLSAVLLPPGAPRGLPLYVKTLTGDQGWFPGNIPVALECLLRAFFLLAEMGFPGSGESGESLGRNLGARFSQAQLLLTADTLFTWPLELLAGEQGPDGLSLVNRLAQAMGPGGCLAELDCCPTGISGLLDLDPVHSLAAAAYGKILKEEKELGLVSRWIYLQELAGWFGLKNKVRRNQKEIERELCGKVEKEASGKRWGAFVELIGFLKD